MEFDDRSSSLISLKENDKRIQIHVDNIVTVIETDTNNRFGITKTYSRKDFSLLTECTTFSGKNIGILKRYDSIGQVVEINLDKDYDFSIEELIKKVEKEYKLNINKISNIGFDRRFVIENNKGKYCYIILFPNAIHNGYRQLTFDGQNGNLIEDKSGYFEE